ncbi:MAG: PHP domain-containing protein [Kiritimatiellae bacterium]|nr:PHP domain-containing protein [Kiritimatiellia bacterium]
MIDLHVHSTVSDGTCTPEQLAEMGKRFSVMALTDHDTVDGVAEFRAACGVQVCAGNVRLAGAELDVAPGEGYGKFHMLALGIDPENGQLHEFLQSAVEARKTRNMRMIEKLNAMGIAITLEDWAAVSPKLLLRPTLARALMAKGYVHSVKEAFWKYIGDDAPAYVSRVHPNAVDAIKTIHTAGGVAVMAHPKHWTHNEGKLFSGLAELMARGLDGIEAVYQANTPDETIMHLRVARTLGMATTAGSDFHGDNKPDITLGMEVDDEATFLKPFFDALERRKSECQ